MRQKKIRVSGKILDSSKPPNLIYKEIGFTQQQIDFIENLINSGDATSFSQAVRCLVDTGISHSPGT